jgi:WD40 repeat protein
VLTGSGLPLLGRDNTARLWDAATGQELRRFEGHTDGSIPFALVPTVGRCSQGRMTRRLGCGMRPPAASYAGWKDIPTRSRPFALVPTVGRCSQGLLTIRLGCGMRPPAELRRFEGHTDSVSSVCFSPDGRQVLTGSSDNTARLWDAATGRQLRRFEGHTDWVRSVCFSPDGRQVLTGSVDKTARLWDAATGQELRGLKDIPTRSRPFALVPTVGRCSQGPMTIRLGCGMRPPAASYAGLKDILTGQFRLL